MNIFELTSKRLGATSMQFFWVNLNFFWVVRKFLLLCSSIFSKIVGCTKKLRPFFSHNGFSDWMIFYTGKKPANYCFFYILPFVYNKLHIHFCHFHLYSCIRIQSVKIPKTNQVRYVNLYRQRKMCRLLDYNPTHIVNYRKYDAKLSECRWSLHIASFIYRNLTCSWDNTAMERYNFY